MPFAIRGVLEGFYGRPWSWPERERMLHFMSQHGFNLYMYAPKNDPIHRNRWREPYLPEEIIRFAHLVAVAKERGVEFAFGISPLQYHYRDPGDFATIWEKLMPLYKVGCRSFFILLDDMPDKFHHEDDQAQFDTIADAQVWLNNTVLDKLRALGDPAVRLYFCPTEYHGQGDSPYLRILGEGMDPAIEIFWSGTEVCSPALRTEDARIVSASLKRPVLYWDNYPVNDLDMQMDPHILPVKGRDADLDNACKGIVANGALQAEASKIVFHTYAQYMDDPAAYHPDAAWQKALLEVTGDAEDAAAVAILGDLARRSALERGHFLDNFLLPQLRCFWDAWGGAPAVAGPEIPDLAKQAPPYEPGTAPGDRAAALDEIAETYARMRAAAERLLGATFRNRDLAAELRPWALKLQGWASVGEAAIEVLRLAMADPHDPAIDAKRETVLDLILTTRENFHWVQGDLTDQFARRCLWAADELKNGTVL
ncbi:MAG: beta-N-acetylglucosaminidase [Symbiobacteriaceae bacterium]|jgi:hyaluronoglucosaminidase|nr:beta-N-acetylglucosaminidase [Symbiobacteriaceae bacterium]